MTSKQLLRCASAAAVLGLCFEVAAQTTSKPAQKSQQDAKQHSTVTKSSSHTQSEGEKIFVQNCARCHTPPDGFSSRISGTIVLHMRVRASLSAHDEQELLRYFNP